MAKILLVDDEEKFRADTARRLNLRGFETVEAGNGEDAIKAARADNEIDIVLLDLKMPGLGGEQTLAELKKYKPALQVIMLTGHGSLESAMATGRLEAYGYLEKPCEFSELLTMIESARRARPQVMARHEIPPGAKGSLKRWLAGTHNSRPGVILLGALIFSALLLLPPPARMVEILSSPKTGEMTDVISGFSDYRLMKADENVAGYYGRKHNTYDAAVDPGGSRAGKIQTPYEVSFKARVMLATLLVAALFWATGALPIGITGLLIGASMYFFGIFEPEEIAQAFASDAVLFVFGILALAAVISKTGLDRRISLLLLGPARSLPRLLFIFLPLLAMACSFVSEYALVAFVMPLFMMVYVSAVRAAGIRKDRALAVILGLALCYAANCGGLGSPAGGGRNAIMMGILHDYNAPITFGKWAAYGMPFVPVMALVVGAYFYFALGRRVKVGKLNVSGMAKKAARQIGPMNRDEYITAAVLAAVVALWIGAGDTFGLGGPVVFGLAALNIMRVLKWRDITSIHWEVVALYAGASALCKGLAETGGALYLADAFFSSLPQFIRDGSGLAVAASLFAGLMANFMGGGAIVSVVGPVAVPMATISGTHPWMVGLATAFGSSFAHMLVIGTPSNAIVYAMGKDPVSGEQLLQWSDFLKHGAATMLLSYAVLWGWTIFGYWRLIGF